MATLAEPWGEYGGTMQLKRYDGLPDIEAIAARKFCEPGQRLRISGRGCVVVLHDAVNKTLLVRWER